MAEKKIVSLIYIPFYRKSWFCSILLLLGLVIVPLIWVVALLLVTGEIYENSYDDHGNLKKVVSSQ